MYSIVVRSNFSHKKNEENQQCIEKLRKFAH